MVTAQGLHGQLAEKISEVKSLVSGLSDEESGRSPREGDWCANEVLSHLIGPELGTWRGWVQAFESEGMPTIEIHPGISHLGDRSGQSLSELLSAFESEYGALGDYLSGLSEEQLNQQAHVPLFKDTPLGEYPTLAQFASGIASFHMADHVQQLRNLRQ